MKSGNIPAPAVRRLSLYLRQLESFQRKDRRTVSSKQLGESLGLTDAQVRKDLGYFGQFGHPGIGYRVDDLIAQLRHILGTDVLDPTLSVRLARERRLRNGPDMNDTKAFEQASGGPRTAPKKEPPPPPPPRKVVDVFRGDKHVQEVFQE